MLNRKNLLFIFFFFLIIISRTAYPQNDIYNRAMFHILNRDFLSAESSLDSAMNFQKVKTSVSAWLRKGEIAYRLLENASSNNQKYNYIEESIYSFEKVKTLSKLNDVNYQQSKDYLLKVWEFSVREAMLQYDMEMYESALNYCSYAKQILPEELTSYLLSGNIAFEIKEYSLMMENYSKLLFSAYYREEVLNRMLNYTLQQGNYESFIHLSDLAAKEFDEQGIYFRQQKILQLHKQSQWILANKELQKIDKSDFKIFDLKYLLAENLVHMASCKESIRVLNSLNSPTSDTDKIKVAELYFILADKLVMEKTDRDGNIVLSKRCKKLFMKAKDYLEAIKVTNDNLSHVRKRLKKIEDYLISK